MNDETKKPAGRGPKGAGAARDGAGGARRDGPRKPFVKRDGASGDARGERPQRDFQRDDRPGEGGERKPFRKPDGDKRPFRKPDGDRPFRKREDAAAGERPQRDFRRDDRPGEGGERKPFRKPDGDRPFRKPDGDRPFRKRDDAAAGGDRPQRDFRRDDRPGEGGERKPFRKPDGDRPFRKPDGDRPFRKREDAAAGDRPQRDFRRDDRPGEGGDRKPFRKPDGDKRPFRKPDGDRPYRQRDDRPQRADDAPRPGRREREEAEQGTGGEERIARRLARAGVASRRDAEEMIAAGRVSVNGKVLDSPALNVGPRDRILVDDKPIPEVERTRLFLFHKPAGVVTTNRDPEGRRTVFDILPAGVPRLMTVGRLDINTEGLILLTNDGGLSRVLELPATGWLRRYRVRVHGKVEPEALEDLRDGIAVDGVFYGGIEATLDREQGSNAWLTLGLREGKNREVKNILGALGLDVTRLIRVSYGPFQLGELREGELRELKGRLLRDQLGERLIEEAGANFDAPVRTEFTNQAVKAEAPRDERPPARKRDRDEKREDALGRLDTRAPRGKGDFKGAPRGDFKGDSRGGKPFGKGGKPGGRSGDREERPVEKPRTRNANVWMAPGARPMGEKKAAAMATRNEGKRYAGKPRPAGKGDRPGPGPKGGPRKPRGDG